MSRPFLWCPDTTVYTEPTYTQEQMQRTLDEAYDRRLEDTTLRAYTLNPKVKTVCQLIAIATNERLLGADLPVRLWGQSVQDYRNEYRPQYLCRTHNKHPEIWFRQKAYSDRMATARTKAGIKLVHLRPTQMDRWDYRWAGNFWVIDRPTPPVIHDLFK